MSEASKTVLVTGASTGIGMETALFFHEQGWQVIATMRHPEKRHTPLHDRGLRDLIHLDVMDQRSIRAAIKYALDKYDRIDVLVNNAGYAVYGPFETCSREQLARQFDTNVFGLMEVTREILPLFRKQQRRCSDQRGLHGRAHRFSPVFPLQWFEMGSRRFYGIPAV